MRFANMVIIATTLLGCGGGTTPTTPPAPTEVLSPDRQLVNELNRRAREGAVTETLHGVEVSDPYRMLETESEETTAWLNAQTERTESQLGEADAAMAARLDTLLSIGVLGAPHPAGDRLFYTERDATREQPVVKMRAADGSTSVVLDPTQFGERAALDWYFPSLDGERVAFGISQNGDERSTLRVINLPRNAQPVMSDIAIEHTRWTTVSWLPDSTGFYYTRYPSEGEPGFDAESPDTYFPRIYFHLLGGDPSADVRVFGTEDPEKKTDFPGVSVSDDGAYVTISNFRGWSASDLYIRSRLGEDAPLVTVVEGRDSINSGVVHRGELFILTNEGAPRYKLMKTPAASPGEPSSWTPVVPEGTGTIEDWEVFGDTIALHIVEDVRSKLVLVGLDGSPRGEVALPGRGSVSGLHALPDARQLYFNFSGYVHPPAIYSYDALSSSVSELARVSCDVDFSGFRVELVRVPSPDGTEVPVHLLYRAGTEPNRDNPVLLYGYGGFNVSLLPAFTRNAIYWLEQGGVYAVANLRGGSEFGESWHRAGMRENKQNVFDDFASVIQWLSTSGWSRPEKIAISGASNGGLLMGAMVTQVPDRVGAVVASVGLYDMVRYHRFPPAELWIQEYGDPEVAEEFNWLHAYSPYHHVRQGTAYPSVLLQTADSDGRVHWSHTAKFAALLQEQTGGDAPIYFHLERSQGHGAGTRRSDLVAKYVRVYSYLNQQLGL